MCIEGRGGHGESLQPHRRGAPTCMQMSISRDNLAREGSAEYYFNAMLLSIYTSAI